MNCDKPCWQSDCDPWIHFFEVGSAVDDSIPQTQLSSRTWFHGTHRPVGLNQLSNHARRSIEPVQWNIIQPYISTMYIYIYINHLSTIYQPFINHLSTLSRQYINHISLAQRREAPSSLGFRLRTSTCPTTMGKRLWCWRHSMAIRPMTGDDGWLVLKWLKPADLRLNPFSSKYNILIYSDFMEWLYPSKISIVVF